MSDERINIEVAIRIQECDGTTVKHIYEIDVDAELWGLMEEWERKDWMRRKLWTRLSCEYKVIGEDEA